MDVEKKKMKVFNVKLIKWTFKKKKNVSQIIMNFDVIWKQWVTANILDSCKTYVIKKD